MNLSLRTRLAAAMAAFRGRTLPALPERPDMSAALAAVEKLRADALAMQTRAEAVREALVKAGRG